MKYQPFRTDVGYEIEFKRPWFELATVQVKVVDALYSAIHPRFPLKMADLQSFGGTSFAGCHSPSEPLLRAGRN